MKILLADDDTDFVDSTAFALRREGLKVLLATDGAQATQRWETDQPDLVVADIWMPRVNGYELCRRIRQESNTPVILMANSTDEQQIVQGFQRGADDCVVKPFKPHHLALRIQAILRRYRSNNASPHSTTLRIGPYRLVEDLHRVVRGEEEIYLTPREFRILYMLAINAGHVVSFQRLSEYVWGYDQRGSAMLKTHVSHLRKKLGMERDQPGYIAARSGIGYVLT